ncbi:hypothetical protein VVR84_15740 [Kocuria carniphila]|uniref:Uncharacterized protein n=1 Tax=Kocuria carniphila TaxID=262208 RepID=A0ABV3V5Z6_9MICC
MKSEVVVKSAQVVATGTLTAHLLCSVIQNTPESFNQDLRRYIGGWSIPGWRFFAPNPGTQNVHLLIREGSNDRPNVGQWRDVTPTNKHGLLQTLWNPGSRGPKALFDAMQQISVMSANYADFTWVRESVAYEIIAGIALNEMSVQSDKVQFLLMNYFPSRSADKRMQPIMTSEWIERNRSRAYK